MKQDKWKTTAEIRTPRNIPTTSSEHIERHEYEGRLTRSGTRAVPVRKELSKYFDDESQQDSHGSSTANEPTPKKQSPQKKSKKVPPKKSLSPESRK